MGGREESCSGCLVGDACEEGCWSIVSLYSEPLWLSRVPLSKHISRLKPCSDQRYNLRGACLKLTSCFTDGCAGKRRIASGLFGAGAVAVTRILGRGLRVNGRIA